MSKKSVARIGRVVEPGAAASAGGAEVSDGVAGVAAVDSDGVVAVVAVEEELKFRPSAAARAAMPDAWSLPPGVKLVPGHDWLAEDLYLDTRALDLLRRGRSCRLRMTGGSVTLTLKGLGEVTEGALHRRSEQEAVLAADATLDPTTWPAGMRENLTAAFGSEGLHGDLRVVAGLSHHRRSWGVVSAEVGAAELGQGMDGIHETDGTNGTDGSDGLGAADGADAAAAMAADAVAVSDAAASDGAASGGPSSAPVPPLAELALDMFWVRAPRRRGFLAGAGQPVVLLYELELERQAADGPAWKALGKALGRVKGLKPLAASKLERALQAIAAQRPEGLPGASGLTPDMPLAQAARLALREQLLALALTEARTWLERDEDAVHQMRVAARRLGGIIRLFAPALPEAARRGRAWRDLRMLRRDLGAVRDLDVAMLQLDAWAAALVAAPDDDADGAADGTADGTAALRLVWQADREAALLQLLARLGDLRHRRLIKQLARWSGMGDTGRAGAKDDEGRTLREAAPALVEDRLQAMLCYAAPLRERDLADKVAVPVEELHALRIAGKALRDGLRPLKALLSPAGRTALKELEGVVDLLGRLQDAVIADTLVLAAPLPAESLAPYRASLAAVEAAVRADLPAILMPVMAADYGARLHEAWA